MHPNITQQGSTAKTLRVALCIAGGLRQVSKCAPTLSNFVHSLEHAIEAHIVTRSDHDFDCVNDTTKMLPRLLNSLYSRSRMMIHSISIMTEESMKTARLALHRLSPSINWTGGSKHTYDARFYQFLQWERCFDGLSKDTDFVLKVRPDAFFHDVPFREQLMIGKDGTHFSFLGQTFGVDDDSIFLLESDIHPGTVDDTFMFGTLSAMRRGVRDVAGAIRQGRYQCDKDEYKRRVEKVYAEEFLGSHRSMDPWMETYPELLYQHHLKSNHLKIRMVGKRSKVLNLDKCRNCNKLR